jgi:uroporphyrinogen decarboxylase
MTHAQRIIKTARLEKADRVPFALLSSGTWCVVSHGSSLKEALALPSENMAGWLYDGYTASDSGLSWAGSGYNNLVIEALGGKVKWRKKGTPDVAEAFFKSAADAKSVNPSVILENANVQKLYDVTRLLVKKENGERLTGGSMWGPFTLAGLLFGADSLMRGIYKDRAAIEELLRFTSELYLAYIQGYIDAGAKVVQMAEPSASGDMISRKHFNEIALPYIRETFHRLSGRDLVLILHICGDVTDRLDLIAQSGAHIMSLDYKVKLAAAREAFAGKIAFAGNLNPVSIVQNGSHDDIVNNTVNGIKEAGEGCSYIVMPGCDIPPLTRLENLQLISKTVREFKY